ncbi:LysR family transcriptional regulator [Oceanisphaera arctica]|uniref:LysR family transcriptional regulator n=1 Tax=Oceanisphaera arctica TaxID=641510 RepID=A0A2P5TPW1_9GAMM|nr:LysR family transcriptional regulator [Oceanisphaera arctica]PPL17691.1 LysR family transcriptional regulator [Oceanisphaera arctica]GHA18672.1 LysR family transcriptional regulator [Oceanisphaera arctica]
MKLHQLDLNLLLAFDALMTQRNVTRAAQQCFISQPAMSHSLNRLRQFFEDPLLVRSATGMQPTGRAQALHQTVRQALELLEQELGREDSFVPATSNRRFVLSTTDYVECVLIPPLIRRLQTEAPGVRIEIEILRDRLPEQALANGEVDLVLGFDEYMQVPGSLRTETWLTEPLAGVVSREHPVVADGINLAQLTELPHVFHSPLGTRESIVDTWLASQGLKRSISVNSQSYMSAAAIVSQSDHLLVLPHKVAVMLAEALPLKRVTLPADLPAYHLNCVWHPLHDRQPALQWLRGLLRSLI